MAGSIELIFLLKCSLKSKKGSYREKNCVENTKKHLKHLSLAAIAQCEQIVDDNSARWGEVFFILSLEDYK